VSKVDLTSKSMTSLAVDSYR